MQLASKLLTEPLLETLPPPVSRRLGVPGLHLAVLSEPYLAGILSGTKTVESRFSTRPIPPYRCVRAGDFVFLKRVSGPVVGLVRVSHVWYYQLDPRRFGQLMSEYGERLGVDDSLFWDERECSSYCTLMELQDVQRLAPLTVPKKDRRGWVVLRKAVPEGQARLSVSRQNPSSEQDRIL